MIKLTNGEVTASAWHALPTVHTIRPFYKRTAQPYLNLAILLRESYDRKYSTFLKQGGEGGFLKFSLIL